jgi:hypothetical protein
LSQCRPLQPVGSAAPGPGQPRAFIRTERLSAVPSAEFDVRIKKYILTSTERNRNIEYAFYDNLKKGIDYAKHAGMQATADQMEQDEFTEKSDAREHLKTMLTMIMIELKIKQGLRVGMDTHPSIHILSLIRLLGPHTPSSGVPAPIRPRIRSRAHHEIPLIAPIIRYLYLEHTGTTGIHTVKHKRMMVTQPTHSRTRFHAKDSLDYGPPEGAKKGRGIVP